MKKLLSKVKIVKPLFFVLAGIAIGTLATIVLITNYSLPTKFASLVSFKPSQLALVTPSPSSSPSLPTQPSDRALKVASFFVVRSSESYKKEKKIEYGVENMSDTKLIEAVAFKYDLDPILLTEKEALMQKTTAQESKPVVNVDAPNVNVESQDYPKHCTSSKIGQFTFTDCY